jgi:hypothetical protein
VDKFPGALDSPKWNQEDINHLNRFLASNEIEEVIVSQQKKSPEVDELTPKFYQTF